MLLRKLTSALLSDRINNFLITNNPLKVPTLSWQIISIHLFRRMRQNVDQRCVVTWRVWRQYLLMINLIKYVYPTWKWSIIITHLPHQPSLLSSLPFIHNNCQHVSFSRAQRWWSHRRNEENGSFKCIWLWLTAIWSNIQYSARLLLSTKKLSKKQEKLELRWGLCTQFTVLLNPVH